MNEERILQRVLIRIRKGPRPPVSELRRRVNVRLSELKTARQLVNNESTALRSLTKDVAALETAQTLAQEVAAQLQTSAHTKIAQIVSHCLETVFDEPYIFRIHFDRKRGKTEARLTFERNGEELDPLGASGCGVVDVAAFALRVSCLMLSQPPLRRLLVLDEPFRFVSPDLRCRVADLLNALSNELGIQFVMVTHDPQLRAGLVITLP